MEQLHRDIPPASLLEELEVLVAELGVTQQCHLQLVEQEILLQQVLLKETLVVMHVVHRVTLEAVVVEQQLWVEIILHQLLGLVVQVHRIQF